jgi:hypothetical protein
LKEKAEMSMEKPKYKAEIELSTFLFHLKRKYNIDDKDYARLIFLIDELVGEVKASAWEEVEPWHFQT